MALDRPPIAAEIRATLAVAAPLAAANLAQMAMQVTNAVMVGHLGAVPLAAAGLGNALNATLLMTSQGLLTAVAPLAAHSFGAGDHPAAGRVAGGGLIVATAVAAPMMATLLVVPPLLSGLGYEPDLVAEIGRFLWAISWGIPGFLGAAVLRRILGILRLGLPIAAMRGLEIGVFVMTGVMMGMIGADALAAHQLVFNVAGVCFMVPLGLAQAATVRVAYQLGRSEPSAARRAAYVALAMGGLFMTAAALLLWTTPRILIGFYLDLGDAANQSTVAIALQLFVIAALFQLFDGVQVIAAGALRGYRDTAVPMLIAATGYWAIGFVGGWLLAFPLGFGAVGLWLGLALGLAVVAVALGLRLQSRARLQIRAAETIVLAAGGVRV